MDAAVAISDEPIVAERKGPTRPTSAPWLAESLAEIARLEALEADWDLDGAHPIDRRACRQAARIVTIVASMEASDGESALPPEIGPVPDGSVAITWEGDSRHVLQICRHGRPEWVECVVTEPGTPPVRRTVDESAAITLALTVAGSS